MQAAAWTPQPVSPPLSLEKGRPARSPTPPFSPSPTLLCPPHILHPQHSVWEVCCLSVFSPSPDCTSSRRMWPQGAAFVALPLLGPTLVWLLTHHWMSGWCDSPRRLPWCPSHRVLLLVWTAIYSITGTPSSERCCHHLSTDMPPTWCGRTWEGALGGPWPCPSASMLCSSPSAGLSWFSCSQPTPPVWPCCTCCCCSGWW
ncbi:translocator protein 2 isoform X3 [Balaenoptera acutorostrata]|uniref:Translocator protein 2 isoform X3 n=1 Tax=Balaenoptera acutorostrata TaxID=9767 RepID=A0ABM3U6Q3_BALAC|nr:translocator protein 2 isoform X3 [Balaenoptera acutorostrata]